MKTDTELFKKTNLPDKIKKWLKNLVGQKQLYTAWYGNAYNCKEIKILWLYVKDKKGARSFFSGECGTVNSFGNQLLVVLLDARDFKRHENRGSPVVNFNLRKADVM